MGAVSILEELIQGVTDIKRWLQTTAHKPSAKASKAALDAATQRQQAAALLARVEKLSAELYTLLDLATDPAVDLAQQVQDLKRENEQLQDDKRELKAQLNRTRSHLQELNVGLNTKLLQETQRGKRVSQELARLEAELGRDPKLFQEFLDRSITDERIVEAKPDEFEGGKRRK